MAEGGTEDTHNMIALTARLQELIAPGQGKEPSDEAHISPEDTAVLDTAQKRVEQQLLLLGREPLKAAKRNTVGTEVVKMAGE